MEVLSSVVHLLTVASQSEKSQRSSIGVFLAEYPILTASVRVLGAWLAEDSLTLAADIYSLLPFLLELCAASTPQEEDADLLKFLLPGLCHLTADDKARPILLEAKLGKTLSNYMQHLLSLCDDSRLVCYSTSWSL